MQELIRNPDDIILELSTALANSIESRHETQESISKAAGVSQPTISRIRHGHKKSISAAVKKLCIYFNINLYNEIPDPSQNKILMDSLRKVWDGSEDDAKAIAAIICNLSAIRKRRISARAK